MRSFPEHVTSECSELIKHMLQRQPNKRISLKQISEDPWVRRNAMAHAEKIGRPELCSSAGVGPDEANKDTNGSAQRHVSAQVESIEKSARVVRDDNSPIAPHQPGCFGSVDRRSTTKISKRLKKLFTSGATWPCAPFWAGICRAVLGGTLVHCLISCCDQSSKPGLVFVYLTVSGDLIWSSEDVTCKSTNKSPNFRTFVPWWRSSRARQRLRSAQWCRVPSKAQIVLYKEQLYSSVGRG